MFISLPMLQLKLPALQHALCSVQPILPTVQRNFTPCKGTNNIRKRQIFRLTSFRRRYNCYIKVKVLTEFVLVNIGARASKPVNQRRGNVG